MRATQYLLSTLKEIPKNCDTISYQLMLRSGMVRQVSSGLYAWLPTGLRVLRKIENIIRDEINKIGFIEMFMPITQPSTLWKQSGRWSEYGTELLRFKNRNNQDYILSPTHEEIVSDLICKEVISHKQFPIQLYQIHIKYRDEARPRFGMVRSREFLMKDGYSFHINHTSLQKTYDNVFDIYHVIFNRIGLNFCVVQADSGTMGGTLSHEFQAYSNYGEDKVAIPISMLRHNKLNNLYLKYNCNNILSTKIRTNLPKETMRLINTSNNIPILELLNKFNISIKKTIKIIAVQTNIKNKTNLHNFLGLIIRGDQQINYDKLAIIPEISIPISIIDLKEIQKIIGMKPTLLNLINLSIPLIIDYNVAIMHDFIIESNIPGKYFFGVNWYRDIPMPKKIADLCQSQYNNNIAHNNKNKTLSICNCVEIGHIFQLGKKYTKSIHSCIQKNNQYNHEITMGCYGIGITRIIAVIIEQYYDKNGIVWPSKIAPFELAIIPINMYNSPNVKDVTEKLYIKFLSKGIDVFIDDRKENPGVMFADMDLIGIPHVLIIGDRNLKNQEVEYKSRKTGIIKKIKLDVALQFLIDKLI